MHTLFLKITREKKFDLTVNKTVIKNIILFMLDIIIYNDVNHLKNLHSKTQKSFFFYFLIIEKNFHLNKYY